MRTNFIVLISFGVVMGWFVSRIYELDRRHYQKILSEES
jgi:hypothetical protein